MQHVRTARGYETLVVTHGEKQYRVTSTPQEVSNEAAQAIIASLGKTMADKIVTYDFARQMDGAKQVSCSGFGQAMIERM